MSTSSKGTWQKLFAGRHGHDHAEPALASTAAASSSSSTSAIRAYLRLRPANAALQAKGIPQTPNIDIISRHEVVAAPSAFLASDTSTHSLVSSATRSSLSGRATGGANDAEIYTFTEVLPEETDQAALYDATARPLIENSLGAGPSKAMSDSLILAYGVSGGGKTCEFAFDFQLSCMICVRQLTYLLSACRHRTGLGCQSRSATAYTLRNPQKRRG